MTDWTERSAPATTTWDERSIPSGTPWLKTITIKKGSDNFYRGHSGVLDGKVPSKGSDNFYTMFGVADESGEYFFGKTPKNFVESVLLSRPIGYPVVNATNGLIGFSISSTGDYLEIAEDGGVKGIGARRGTSGTMLSTTNLGWTGR